MKKEVFLALAVGLLAGCQTNNRVESSYSECGFAYDLASSPVPGASTEELEHLALMPSPPLNIVSTRQYRVEPGEKDLTIYNTRPRPMTTEIVTNTSPRVIYYVPRPVTGSANTTAPAPIIQESAGAQPQAATNAVQPGVGPAYLSGSPVVVFDTNGLAGADLAGTNLVLSNNVIVQTTNQVQTNRQLLQTNVAGMSATNRSIREPAGTELRTNSNLNPLAVPSTNSAPTGSQQRPANQSTQPATQQTTTRSGTQQSDQTTPQTQPSTQPFHPTTTTQPR